MKLLCCSLASQFPVGFSVKRKSCCSESLYFLIEGNEIKTQKSQFWRLLFFAFALASRKLRALYSTLMNEVLIIPACSMTLILEVLSMKAKPYHLTLLVSRQKINNT